MGKCKNCCRHLCIYCHNVGKEGNEYKCFKIVTIEKNCVTGKDDTILGDCLKLNKEGNCSEYNENREAVARGKLIKAVNSYYREHCMCQSGDNIKRFLVRQLKYELDGVRDTSFFVTYNPNYFDGRINYKYDENGSYTKAYKKYMESR